MIVQSSSPSQAALSDPPLTTPPDPMRICEGLASWQALRARRWYAVMGAMTLLTLHRGARILSSVRGACADHGGTVVRADICDGWE